MKGCVKLYYILYIMSSNNQKWDNKSDKPSVAEIKTSIKNIKTIIKNIDNKFSPLAWWNGNGYFLRYRPRGLER